MPHTRLLRRACHVPRSSQAVTLATRLAPHHSSIVVAALLGDDIRTIERTYYHTDAVDLSGVLGTIAARNLAVA
ncbi:MAG: hypothetical protein WCB85_04100 [Candidatus Dormiibacterota bacterium]